MPKTVTTSSIHPTYRKRIRRKESASRADSSSKTSLSQFKGCFRLYARYPRLRLRQNDII